MADRTIEYLILARDKASAVLDKVGASAERAGKHSHAFSTAVGTFAGGLASGAAQAGLSAISGAVRSSFAGAQDAARQVKLLDNQIKNLGPSGKAAFSTASDFAEDLSNNIGQDDDDIRAVLTKLASFPDAFRKGSLGADAMKRATQAAFDLQAIGIGDASSNIIGIGKALNDPIKGMNALSRAGVSFSNQQKVQIEQAIKHGDLAKAQKILLEGIESNAKGAAAAGVSNIDKLKVSLKNLGEGIAGKVLPLVETFAGWFIKALPGVSKFFGKIADGFGGVVSDFVAGFTLDDEAAASIGVALEGFVGFGRGVREALTNAWEAVGRVVQWVRGSLFPAFRKVADDLMPKIRDAFKSVSKTVSEHRDILEKVRGVFKVVGMVITQVVVPALGVIAGVLVDLLGPAFKGVVWILEKVLFPAIKLIADIFLAQIGAVVNGAAIMFGWIPGIGPKLKDAATNFNNFRDDVNRALSGIRDRAVAVTVTVRGPNGRPMKVTDYGDGTVRVGNVKARARGGPVTAGMPYLVGEYAPELFVPDQNGTIVPSVRSGRSGGGNIYNISLSGLAGDKESVARAVVEAIGTATRRGYIPRASMT